MKSAKTIINEMTSGPSKTLFCDMQDYCKKKALDVFETFFGEDVTPRVSALWLSDPKFVEWMGARLLPEPQEPEPEPEFEGRRWFYKDQPREEIVKQSVEVVAARFITSRATAGNDAGYTDYSVKDMAAKIVEPLSCADGDRQRDIARALKEPLEEDGYFLNTAEAMKIWDYATVHGRVESAKPKLCSQPDDGGWCLHRITVRPDASVAIPETKAFLARINDGDAFSAWLYGIASGRYVGRQVLWLKGEGSDGKSTFFKAFASLFGSTAGSVDWNALKTSPAFAGAMFVNKRFVYIPDNQNPELLNTGLFKSLSDPGSDPVVINHKYGKMYSTELEAHTAVLSNHYPAIRNETHSLSRALFLTIEPRDLSIAADKKITERFIGELSGFLAYGEECYNRLCKNNTEIEINTAAQSAIFERLATSSEQWQTILDSHFVLDLDGSIENGKVYELLTGECRLTNNQVGDFRGWLDREHKVRWVQIAGAEGKRSRGYKGIRLRTSADARTKYLKVVK